MFYKKFQRKIGPQAARKGLFLSVFTLGNPSSTFRAFRRHSEEHLRKIPTLVGSVPMFMKIGSDATHVEVH